jgi:tetratricopeptide (TPR) repeat protein
MSLLMDALRKAEEAKRKAHNARGDEENTDKKSAAASALDLEPVQEPKPEANLEHGLGATTSDEREELDLTEEPSTSLARARTQGGASTTSAAFPSAGAVKRSADDAFPAAEQGFGSATGRATSPAPGSEGPSTQRTAQTIFDAKMPPLRNARMWLLFGGVPLLLVMLATGAYFLWLDLTRGAGLVSRPTASARVAPAVIARTKSPAPPRLLPDAAPSDIAAMLPTAAPLASQAQATQTEASLPIQLRASGAATPAVEAMVRSPGQPAVESRAVAPATPAATGPGVAEMVSAGDIKIARRTSPVRLSPDLKQAFAAYNSGNHASARIAYRRVLQRDANNLHALLGLAAIATQNGLANSAAQLYAKVIRFDPNNSVARAALLAMRKNVDPVAGESQIKRLLVREPDAAHLHFTLGNLYAAQSRWAQAQGAYFNAYRANPDNADFAYNLAVSLDQLAQANAALEYYRRALTLADGKSVGFDPTAVLKRVRVLAGVGASE